ncbi:MAG: C25 family peptidase propeptide domain-containing protein [Ignavibacteriaceae bacterium]|nr:C25 family peptidase propeptide domain-containing protein [Ignavibacteriaceae bacterium]
MIESDENHIIIEFNFGSGFNIEDFFIDGIKFSRIVDPLYPIQDPGNPYLPTRYYNIGIPLYSEAKVTILDEKKDFIKDKFIIAAPDSADQPYKSLRYNQDVYGVNNYFPANAVDINSTSIFRYLKTASLFISPFQFNPVERTLIHNKKIRVRIDYNPDVSLTGNIIPVQDNMTNEYIKFNLINPDEALMFTGKTNNQANKILDDYWYNPNKDYYKIYLNKKGVYRITYDQLITAGISPSSGIQDGKLEIFNDGISLPIDIVDVQQDGVFNSGDYFQFVGKPATPHDEYTRMNIYNTSNVYFFSYQADTVNNYKHKEAYSSSNITPLITNTVETITWEKDTLYQRLGYADNDKRDYWYWDWSEARNRAPYRDFNYWIKDSLAYWIVDSKPQSKIRVGMHGLSNISCFEGNGHDVTLKLNAVTLGVHQWNGQKSTVFEKNIYLARFSSPGSDTIQLNIDSQKFEIILYGNVCPTATYDNVLINYIELDYWRWNRTYPFFFYF